MTVQEETREDRLDRIERILAETVAGLAEVRAIQAETAAAQAETAAGLAEVRAIQAETAAAQAETAAELAEVRAIQAETAAAQAETAAGLAEVRAIQAEAAAAQAEAAAAHEERLARIEAMTEANASFIEALGKRVDQLTNQQQRNNQDLSVIKGWQTELAVERNAREIFSRLSPRGSLMRIYPKDELAHYVTRGTRQNFITGAEGEDATAIDFLMEGTDHAGAPVMLAVEVSYAAGRTDIERALRRAPLLAKMLGRDVVLPAVAAETISEAFEEDARTHQINWTHVPNGNRIMQ